MRKILVIMTLVLACGACGLFEDLGGADLSHQVNVDGQELTMSAAALLNPDSADTNRRLIRFFYYEDTTLVALLEMNAEATEGTFALQDTDGEPLPMPNATFYTFANSLVLDQWNPVAGQSTLTVDRATDNVLQGSFDLTMQRKERSTGGGPNPFFGETIAVNDKRFKITYLQ